MAYPAREQRAYEREAREEAEVERRLVRRGGREVIDDGEVDLTDAELARFDDTRWWHYAPGMEPRKGW